MSNKVLIAAYGSLRKGMSNFGVNARGGGEYSFTGKTKNCYNLYRYGQCYFPSVSLEHDTNGTQVVVDVFEAPESGMLGAYDRLEGYPDFYNRTEITVVDSEGKEHTAWIYHIDEEQDTLVQSGDWVEFNKKGK